MIKLDTNMQIDAPQGLFMTTQIQYTIKIALSVQLSPSSIIEFVCGQGLGARLIQKKLLHLTLQPRICDSVTTIIFAWS